MQGTVRRASCPQLVLDKKRVGHFFGFSKTKDAKIWKWHFSEKNKKTSTIINQNMPKKIQWYPILPDDQNVRNFWCNKPSFDAWLYPPSPWRHYWCHLTGWPQNDGPWVSGGRRLKIWPFFGIYMSLLDFWAVTKKFHQCFDMFEKKTVETSSELQGVLCSAVCEQKSESRDRD